MGQIQVCVYTYACISGICSCDLDPIRWPWCVKLTYIFRRRACTPKIRFLGKVFQKSEHEQDTKTDTQTHTSTDKMEHITAGAFVGSSKTLQQKFNGGNSISADICKQWLEEENKETERSWMVDNRCNEDPKYTRVDSVMGRFHRAANSWIYGKRIC